MPPSQSRSHGTEPPPTSHPLPRRASPDNSVTLRNHGITRNASLKASPGSPAVSQSRATSSPRRNSSGESHDTGQSDPTKWFEQSNQNPTATFDNNVMEVDPPFFQKETDSSNEDKPYGHQADQPRPRLATGHSSSGDDYRSVIDDLTVEIQKLKEELKRYKQQGPEMLRKEKLFEIKYHGLPKRKRRELETTLRDFAAGIRDFPDGSSSQRMKSSRNTSRNHLYPASGTSKHASSSSGSNTRPVDSAYASMSSTANSSGQSLAKPSGNSRAKNDQKVESYLRDIPEGLYPRHILLTDKDRKKLVVRRLEQLFTGKIGGRSARSLERSQAAPPRLEPPRLEPPRLEPPQPALPKAPQVEQQLLKSEDSSGELAREAQMLPTDKVHHSEKKNRSRENVSTSNSNGDQTESGGNGGSSRSGTNPSPPQAVASEQRPTRVKDLDPDRTQVPSENMEYIRHLGLVPPELLDNQEKTTPDVQPDADGWVYLNLLCNMAQLHIINVTPSFVRSAVSEMSSKFQLSPDGRKIRWRGGTEGTRFSSESGDNSQESLDSGETENSPNKRQKTGNSTGDDGCSGGSSKRRSKFGPQVVSTVSESFHYKPLFVHNSSPNAQTTLDDTLSSFGPIEESNAEDSRWGLSGSGGTSNRKKRRHDGAIIYYSGAPFCTDLSGDPGDVSPTTYMLSSGQDQERKDPATELKRPKTGDRSASGTSLSYRPLSEFNPSLDSGLKMDVDSSDNVPDLATDSDTGSSEGDFEFPWSNAQQFIEVRPLEPCGLGGVMPDDHFMVVVTTKRQRGNHKSTAARIARYGSEKATEGIVNRLATMTTTSPAPPVSRQSSPDLEIEYVSGRIKRLAPVPLPPPALFVPPFSSDSSASDGNGFSGDGDDEGESSEEFMSRQVNPHRSDGYPDGVDLSSGDEDGEDPDDEPDSHHMYDPMDRDEDPSIGRATKPRAPASSAEVAPGSLRRVSKSESVDAAFRTGGSSAATAGGVPSGCSSTG